MRCRSTLNPFFPMGVNGDAATADGKGWDVDSAVNQSGAVCCSVLCLLVCIDVMKDVTQDVLGKIVVIL